MKMCGTFLLGIALCGARVSMAQISSYQPPSTISIKIPHAAMDLLQFQGSSPMTTRVDLYTAVSFNSLDFLYTNDRYAADYSVSVQVLDQDSEVFSRTQTFTAIEEVISHRDRIAGGSHRSDPRQISFELRSDQDYSCKLSIQDISSKHEFDTTIPLRTKRFNPDATEMSDLLMYRDRIGHNIVPLIGSDVSELEEEDAPVENFSNSSESGIFAMLYHVPPDSALGIVSEIVDKPKGADSEIVLLKRSMSFRAAHESSGLTAPGPVPQAPLFIPFRFDGLWPGKFTLRTYLLPTAQDTALTGKAILMHEALAEAERTISVRIASGIPSTLTDMDLAIDELRTIATSSEWDSLRSAKTPKEKSAAIVAFWNAKSRSAALTTLREDYMQRAMEIFYSRIDYANSHFTTAFGPGWKSDRGKVYLALGPPDEIQDATTQSQMRAVQLWNYGALGFQYTFIDEYELGDFRLRGTFPPEGTFIIDR